MKLMQLVHTLLSRLLLLILILISIIPFCVMLILPARIRFRNRVLFWLIDLVYWLSLKLTFVPITIVGAENIPHTPVIFAANHQSSMDIPLVGELTHGKPHIWLARSELMNTFFLRWILPRVSVVVDVNSGQKAMRSLITLMRLVEGADIDVMIFPEGARFTDGSVHEFFGGFVTLAKALQRPVIPVRIFGANKVYPPHTFLISYYPIKVVVGHPFVLGENETDDEFKERVYQWFVSQTEG